jgi:Fic family protein
VFVLFVTSEVHPFADGNGRISRIMMNAELTAAGQAKVIVPTVFRPDYIGALRRLSRNGDPSVLVKAMTRLRDFSRRLVGDDVSAMRRQLEEANAFKDDDNFILRF